MLRVRWVMMIGLGFRLGLLVGMEKGDCKSVREVLI